MLKVIEIALSQVGYYEKRSNSQLDDFTANAGSGNWTKYARDLDNIPDFYNTKKNGFAWCDIFVDWCFVKAYGVEMAEKLLCQPKNSLGAGCFYSARYYKEHYQFYAQNPKVGDQIFFDYGDDVAHTGLVWKVDSNYVYTVEGNTSAASGVIPNGDGVYKKQYPLNYFSIYGYGRPDYALVGESQNNDPVKDPVEDQKGDKIMLEVKMLQKGSTGSEVETVQALLVKKYGISCGIFGVDGDFGNATDSAVRKFQKQKNLEVDGIVGQNTWKALIGV